MHRSRKQKYYLPRPFRSVVGNNWFDVMTSARITFVFIKMCLNFVHFFQKFIFLQDIVPQIPTGAPPLDPDVGGTPIPQTL